MVNLSSVVSMDFLLPLALLATFPIVSKKFTCILPLESTCAWPRTLYRVPDGIADSLFEKRKVWMEKIIE